MFAKKSLVKKQKVLWWYHSGMPNPGIPYLKKLLITKHIVFQPKTSFMEKPYPGGRDFVRQSFLSRGVPSLGANVILSSLAETTLTQYNTYLKKWWKFCQINLKKPIQLLIRHTNFLFNRAIQCWCVIYDIKFTILIPIIRVFRQIPPRPKYHTTWDPSVVLKYLSTIYPLAEATLPKLTVKLVTLLSLITGHRIQTLSKIRITNIIHFDNRLEIKIPDIIKTTKCKNNFQPLLIIPYFHQNPELCLASVINVYIERTRASRTEKTDFLILTYKKPFHPATTQHISKWIKMALTESGVDISKFSSYSTRHAATSAAHRAGVSIETIREAAGWTEKSQTFNKFYNRPLCPDPTAFAKAVVNDFVKQ
ncbi:hypothetical protein NQ317_008279 [Molorchus minor]|uniref:Tyr recombinase domain-containing protein n=1 Tax=Molorchus minor TaxID=1323400 RepID=A0ABQ9J9Z4_9CUCU|nr:hypothetical protein NQ317_008279 [Molorchus minor]